MTRLFKLILLILLAGFSFWFFQTKKEVSSHQAVLEKFIDHLDFKRFTEAYSLVLNQEEVSREEFLRDLTRDGGLLMSFAKLAEMNLKLKENGKSRVIYQTKILWITSLNNFTVVEDIELVRDEKNAWRIYWKSPVYPTPAKKMLVKSKKQWMKFTSSSVDATFNYAEEVADRPQIDVLSKKILVFDRILERSVSSTAYNLGSDIPSEDFAERLDTESQKQVYVIGQVQNVSSTPAHVTITVILRDEDGEVIAKNNVMDKMLHRLYPYEKTPFRVDVGYVDGKTKYLEVHAIGTATDFILEKTISVHNAEKIEGKKQMHIAGELYNMGVDQGSIPHLIFSLYNKQKELIWVDDYYLKNSVQPSEVLEFKASFPPEIKFDSFEISTDCFRTKPLIGWHQYENVEYIVYK